MRCHLPHLLLVELLSSQLLLTKKTTCILSFSKSLYFVVAFTTPFNQEDDDAHIIVFLYSYFVVELIAPLSQEDNNAFVSSLCYFSCSFVVLTVIFNQEDDNACIILFLLFFLFCCCPHTPFSQENDNTCVIIFMVFFLLCWCPHNSSQWGRWRHVHHCLLGGLLAL